MVRAAAALLAGLAAGVAFAADEPARGFEVTRLAEGVHAVIRREPVGMMSVSYTHLTLPTSGAM